MKASTNILFDGVVVLDLRDAVLRARTIKRFSSSKGASCSATKNSARLISRTRTAEAMALRTLTPTAFLVLI
jgi:hypothetical protein